MNELSSRELLDGQCLAVTGKSIQEGYEKARVMNREVIRSIDDPYNQTGGIAALFGNLAPDGAVVKQGAVAKGMLVHQGPARIFNSEEEAMAAITGGKIQKGDVVVIQIGRASCRERV